MKKFTLLILFLIAAVTGAFSQGNTCSDPIVITTLPYTHSDNTANYANNFDGGPGTSCGSYFTNHMYGNDVVYAYTAAFDGSINLYLSTNMERVGLFAFASCANIGQSCLDGITNDEIVGDTMSIQALSVTQGQTYYFLISNAAPTETIFYTLNIMENTCMNAEVSYTVMSDCSVTEQFRVLVDVTHMGSAESMSILDNFGSDGQSITEAGSVTFGPYPNGTEVQFTVTNDQDWNCYMMSALKTSLVCAPVNDLCANAIDLATQTSPINGTTYGATNQNYPVCTWNDESGDVYYSMEVPNNHTLTIGLTNTDFDAMVTALVGDCEENLVIMCEDNDTATYTFVNDIGYARTFYWVIDGFNGAYGNYELTWSVTDCLQPVAVFEVVPDCAEGNKFLMYATIYSFGSAESVTVSDNLGGLTQTTTEPETVIIMGPYDNFTQVALTVANTADPSCFYTGNEMTLEECPLTCVPATYYYTQELLCPSPGFMVTVHVTGLGTAESVTITDDQGNPFQTAVVGDYQFGPYVDYTTVNFSIVNGDNPGCFSNIQAISYMVCPPANDSCANPTALVPGGDFETAAMLVTSEGATLSTEMPNPTCGNMFFQQAGKDVWYTVTIPPSGSMTIETAASGGTAIPQLTDSAIQVYAGTCSDLTSYLCDDDGGDGSYSKISLTEMNPSDVMYIRVFGKFGGQGAFKIAAYDESLLAAPSFDTIDLVSYPNPVKDVLNISTSAAITSVAVFNLVGQKVYAKVLDASNSQIDMSHLSAGTYLVKVNADNRVKTLKIVKE